MRKSLAFKSLFHLLGLVFLLTCNPQRSVSQVSDESEADSLSLNTSDEYSNGGKVFWYDIRSYYKGLGHVFSRPLHWKKKDWRNVGLVAGGTVLSLLADEPVRRFMNNNRSGFLDGVEEVGDLMGRPVPGFVFSGTMYGLSHIAKNEWMRETAVITVISISTAGLIQTISKSSIGRGRPVADEGPLSFKPFNGTFEYHSFPSGHTIVAATTTLAIAKNFKNKWVKGGIIGLGAITAWSRVYTGAHWLSDVTLSYALSYFTVETVSKFRKAMNERNPNKRFNVSFIPTFNGASVIVSL